MLITGPIVRNLTFDERRMWGECPVCHAGPGEACLPMGYVMRNANGDPAPDGVHLGRLNKAPHAIEIRPIAGKVVER